MHEQNTKEIEKLFSSLRGTVAWMTDFAISCLDARNRVLGVSMSFKRFKPQLEISVADVTRGSNDENSQSVYRITEKALKNHLNTAYEF